MNMKDREHETLKVPLQLIIVDYTLNDPIYKYNCAKYTYMYM